MKKVVCSLVLIFTHTLVFAQNSQQKNDAKQVGTYFSNVGKFLGQHKVSTAAATLTVSAAAFSLYHAKHLAADRAAYNKAYPEYTDLKKVFQEDLEANNKNYAAVKTAKAQHEAVFKDALYEQLVIEKPIKDWNTWKDIEMTVDGERVSVKLYPDAERTTLKRVEYYISKRGYYADRYVLRYKKVDKIWKLTDAAYFQMASGERTAGFIQANVSSIINDIKFDLNRLAWKEKDFKQILPNYKPFVNELAPYESKMSQESAKFVETIEALEAKMLKRGTYIKLGVAAAVIFVGYIIYDAFTDSKDAEDENTIGMILQECGESDEGCVIRLLSSSRVTPASVHRLAKLAKLLMPSA